jgi:hydrogenase nickel incorporation protein HypA/HybF
MHEVGICQSIFNTLESELTEEELAALQEIHLKIGILSGVEPMFLKHVFSFMVKEQPFENASLHIERTDVLAACELCGTNFKVENYVFRCPRCSTPSGNVVQGKELEICKLIFHENTKAEPLAKANGQQLNQ